MENELGGSSNHSRNAGLAMIAMLWIGFCFASRSEEEDEEVEDNEHPTWKIKKKDATRVFQPETLPLSR